MTDTAPRRRQVPGGVDGHRIRRLRVAAGLTAEKLAERAAPTSVQHICDIERGRRRPSAPLLHRIATALGTTSAVLMEPEVQHVDG
ncbi:helix-turn-helix transcriptional regulator [Actinoplanes sp. NPDC051861]|uniref:helix-turn-helix domain-containing protein n=1 Tax=Actinoplanes sp. NPDC051861 TaxID=3155170 RepID=UPI0034483709